MTGNPTVEQLAQKIKELEEETVKRKQAELRLRESEEKYRQLFQSQPSGFALHEIILDDQGKPCDYRFLECNNVYQEITGLKAGGLIGNTVREVMPEIEPYWIETYGEVALTGQTINFDNFSSLLNKHFHVSAYSPVPGRFVTNFYDITERKQVVDALQESEQQLSRIYESVGDVLFSVVVEPDDCFRFLSVNRAFLDSTGLAEDRIIGKRIEEVIPEPSVSLVRENYKKAIRENKIIRWEETSEYPAGTKVGDVAIAPVFDPSGICTHLIGSVHDLTERKEAEDALRESISLLDATLASTADGILVVDMDEKIATYNDKFRAMWEIPEAILNMGENEKLVDYVLEKMVNPEAYSNIVMEMRTHPERPSFDTEELKDGRIIEGYSYPQYLDEAIVGRVLSFRDVTERKQAERALFESEIRYRSLFEQAGDGILICEFGDEGIPIITDANKAVLRMHGYSREEMIGRPITFLDPAVTAETVAKRFTAYQSGGPVSFEVTHKKKEGTSIDLVVTVSMVTIGGKSVMLAVEHDITDRKSMEEQRERAAKLESVGTLAGGIAHDFNNILMGLFGNMELAEMYLEQGDTDTAKGMLVKAGKASVRAKALTQQLLTFARGGAPVIKATHINELIRESASFCLTGSKTKAAFRVPDDLWAAEADAGQISQVITNLVLNAEQAMPTGGTISIGASNKVVGKESDLPLPAGHYILIDIEDQGIGIPKEHWSKIFDPYFTTKQKGSGLGLAGTYSIVKNHGGYLTFESEPGVGTRFHIYLPASQAQVEQQEPVISTQPEPVAQGRILVMDDEDPIRDMIRRMLNHAGYEVSLSKDGVEAIARYSEAKALGKPFAAVIMDLTIPGGMGGREAIGKLLEIDSQVKAIVSSGYATDPIMAQFKEHGFSGVVAKPYRVGDLLDALRRVLEGQE